MKNQHKEFNLYLGSIIQFLEEQEWNNIENDIKELKIIKDIFKKIQSNNIIHSKLENERTYLKWVELQNELKERIKSYKSKNPKSPS